MVRNVVGQLDDSYPDVGKNSSHLRVVAQHRRVLKSQDHGQHVVGHCGVDLIHRLDDPDDVGIMATQVSEGSNPGHGPGEVFPYADRGVYSVYAT